MPTVDCNKQKCLPGIVDNFEKTIVVIDQHFDVLLNRREIFAFCGPRIGARVEKNTNNFMRSMFTGPDQWNTPFIIILIPVDSVHVGAVWNGRLDGFCFAALIPRHNCKSFFASGSLS